MKKNIYFFQWISDLGGADTRLKELIQCFSKSKNYNLFIIPNDNFKLAEKNNIDFLNLYNVKILTWENLPSKTDGYAIAFCNFRLFSQRWRIEKIKSIGLKFIWSNDMMWSSEQEAKAINDKLVSSVVFTSEFHKNHLLSINPSFKDINNFIVPNYFYYDNYHRVNKKSYLNNKFVIGKLSRAEWTKYSENFPLFFNKINIPNTHFRFMGWNDKLKEKYKWFEFNSKFELLEELKETPIEFLSQLDLYLFNSHHNYIENQSRSIIEAQLLGIPCVVPNEGNFPKMISHKKTGFIFNTNEECYKYINLIYENKDLYKTMSENAKILAKNLWCDQQSQLEYWNIIFESI